MYQLSTYFTREISSSIGIQYSLLIHESLTYLTRAAANYLDNGMSTQFEEQTFVIPAKGIKYMRIEKISEEDEEDDCEEILEEKDANS